MSTATSRNLITAEQFFAMTEPEFCELVHGEVIELTPTGWGRGDVALAIATTLRRYLDEHPGLGKVVSEVGFVLTEDPDTVRVPDVAFTTADRSKPKSFQRYFPGPPDLAVEVLSPNDRASQISDKVRQYLDAGARQVWVVDPQRPTLTRYTPDKPMQVFDVGDTVDGGDLLPGLRMPLEPIFAD